MKSGQGSGDFQQTNVRTGDKMSITQQNRYTQQDPMANKAVN